MGLFCETGFTRHCASWLLRLRSTQRWLGLLSVASADSTHALSIALVWVYTRQVTRSLLDMGCYSVSLGDTIGAGTAGSTVTLMESLKEAAVPLEKTAMHFHDTYGQALANILVALEEVRGCRRLTDNSPRKSTGRCGGCDQEQQSDAAQRLISCLVPCARLVGLKSWRVVELTAVQYYCRLRLFFSVKSRNVTSVVPSSLGWLLQASGMTAQLRNGGCFPPVLPTAHTSRLGVRIACGTRPIEFLSRH